jgi:molybdenum cofactor cytidylyltransferase
MSASPDNTLPVVLLLAAGEGQRFGGVKQLADIAGEPMVRRVARSLLELDLPVIVVTGAYAEEVEVALNHLPLSVVRYAGWALGMGNSLAAGVREVVRIYPQASSVLICLADQPLLPTAFPRAMLERHAVAPDRILATELGNASGPPALFPHDCFDALTKLAGSHGARSIIERNPSRVELFVTDDRIDVDTQEDLQKVCERLAGTSAFTHNK